MNLPDILGHDTHGDAWRKARVLLLVSAAMTVLAFVAGMMFR